VKKLLKKTLVTIDDVIIKEGVSDLKRAGTFETMSPAQIKNHIVNYKITPKRELFKQRAVEFLCAEDNNLIDQIRARMQPQLKTDPNCCPASQTCSPRLACKRISGKRCRVKSSISSWTGSECILRM